MVAGPFTVPVPVNITAKAPLLIAITTTSVPANNPTSVPAYYYTPVVPAHFQQQPLLLSPLRFLRQKLLLLSIVIQLFSLHLTQR